MNEFRSAVSEALSRPRLAELIEGVKEVVAKELQLLDPSTEVHLTSYFNHSFVPDMTVTWKDPSRRGDKREIFLRPSVASTVAAKDILALEEVAPVFLSLRSEEAGEAVDAAERDLDKAQSSLLTNVDAIDHFAHPGQKSGVPEESPLLGLVRNNVIRGGRGLFLGDRAGKLTDNATILEKNINNNPQASAEFLAMVNALFTENAANRLRHSAELISLAFHADEASLVALEGASGEGAKLDALADGRSLSFGELQTLLPYLLNRADATSDLRFWRHLGGMLSFNQFEKMWGVLSDTDVSRLVSAMAGSWKANKALLSINERYFEGDPGIADQKAGDAQSLTGAPEAVTSSGSDDGWRFDAKMPCLTVGPWKLHVTDDGRKVKSRRKGSSRASWGNLADRLRSFDVSSISLQGGVRDFEINSRKSNLFTDVVTLAETFSEQFSVSHAGIRGRDGGSLDVDFGEFYIEAREAVLVDIVEAALQLLGHAIPISSEPWVG